MLTPTSRLGDDLYLLYLACMAWLLLPFYGEGATAILPSQWQHFDRAFDVGVVAVALLGGWSGIRGGPLMITRAVIVHELGSPVSKRRVLLPWLLRQTVAWAMAGAVFATIGLILADKSTFGYEAAFRISIAALIATWFAMFLATGWMVATHRRYDRSRWIAICSAQTLAPVAALVAGVTFSSWGGVTVLVVLAAVVTALTVIVLDDAPVEPLWKRASAVESMRSSMQRFDFQRVFLDLRNASEQPPFSSGRTWASRRMPLPVWRHIAAVQHTLGWHLTRLATFVTLIAVLVWFGDTDQGIITLGLAVTCFLLGLELAGAVAALADQLTFIVHYPNGSAPLLRSQVAMSGLVAAALGLVVIGGRLSGEARSSIGVILLCAAGALGATVQARLGSPDIAAYLDKYGVLNLSKVLWARALLGPMVVLGVAIAGFHQFQRPNPNVPSLVLPIAVVLIAGFVISTRPLEGQVRKAAT